MNEWKKSFRNFSRVLDHIETFMKQKSLTEIEIEAFFYSFGAGSELIMKIISQYALESSDKSLLKEDDIIEYAFKNKLISSKEHWVDMLVFGKNLSVGWASDLDIKDCEDKINKIKENYYNLFLEFTAKMETLEIHYNDNIFVD